MVNAIVETPKGSDHKFKLISDYGLIAYHHVLPDELTWPYDYGFVPQTLAPDGDAVDILVLTDDGLFAGCLVEARLIGAILQTEDGIENDRLIAVPVPSPARRCEPTISSTLPMYQSRSWSRFADSSFATRPKKGMRSSHAARLAPKARRRSLSDASSSTARRPSKTGVVEKLHG